VDDPARAFEMGRAARAKVARDFAAGDHVARLAEIYAEAGAATRAA
jgi:hypothetical protein